MHQHHEEPKEEGIGYEATMEIFRELRERHIIQSALRSKASMLLRLLDRRGLTVEAATRARVTACEDADQLEQWFDRAIVASRTDEVFA